jgi:putative transposase
MRGFRHWRWHHDEVFVEIDGEPHHRWRAVDHKEEILESYVTKNGDSSRLSPL